MAPRKRHFFSKDFYENHVWQKQSLVCGVDEVGRGCLAGPVVVSACILYPNSKHNLLKDSKLLNEQEREQAYAWIVENSWFTVCSVNHSDIDRLNIWNSTLKAMRQACLNLFLGVNQVPEIILVDAMPLSLKGTAYENIEIQHFIEGESHSSSIAAASILAKVTRDRLMNTYSKVFPAYKLDQHKGYATKAHYEGLSSMGYSIIHRLSFLNNFKEVLPDEEQRSIFCGNSRKLTLSVDSSKLGLE